MAAERFQHADRAWRDWFFIGVDAPDRVTVTHERGEHDVERRRAAQDNEYPLRTGDTDGKSIGLPIKDQRRSRGLHEHRGGWRGLR